MWDSAPGTGRSIRSVYCQASGATANLVKVLERSGVVTLRAEGLASPAG